MAATPDSIDVIEQVLDAPAALAAIAVGIFVGCVGLYAYQLYHKNLVDSIRQRTIQSIQYIDQQAQEAIPPSEEVIDYDTQQRMRLAEFGQ